MIEAGAPSTGSFVAMLRRCARPTGVSHGITRGPAQRRGGAKRRPHCLGWVNNNAANNTRIINKGRDIPKDTPAWSVAEMLTSARQGAC